jgi:hypothetical protein
MGLYTRVLYLLTERERRGGEVRKVNTLVPKRICRTDEPNRQASESASHHGMLIAHSCPNSFGNPRWNMLRTIYEVVPRVVHNIAATTTVLSVDDKKPDLGHPGPYVVLSRLGSARFGLAQQRFDQIGRAKPNQTMACGG